MSTDSAVDDGVPAPTDLGVQDPRIAHTRSSLRAAFLRLRDELPLAKISVSRLCQEAGISRPTFYQHFANLDEVQVEALRERLDALRARLLAESADLPVDERRRVGLIALLRGLRDQRELYVSALDEQEAPPLTHRAVREWIQEQIAETVMGEPFRRLSPHRRTETVFVAGGAIALLAHWLYDSSSEQTPEEAAARIEELAGRVLDGG